MIYIKLYSMQVLATILLAGNLFPIQKDTTKPVFNMYTIRQEAKVPANYYTTKTGFFCNTERALEKQTKVQVKVRLGSLEQTQKLEGYNLSKLPANH
jgi:hypothetical protein